MPAKNSVKEFVADSYYHIYNRGVEKRVIFIDEQDYNVFISYLKTYLVSKDTKKLHSQLANPKTPWSEKDKILKLLRLNNFSDDLKLISYCLMPNHFHLLVIQKDSTTIDRFMNSLCTRYSMYFNRKYKRVGCLFQDVYKAVRVSNDEHLLEISRYIHRNPIPQVLQGDPLQNLRKMEDYMYSSYKDYFGSAPRSWIATQIILEYFSLKGPNTYAAFVSYNDDRNDEVIQEFGLDKDE